jgi:ribA/ribD-fused uncharacterized protein
VQTENKRGAPGVISREFGINMKDMKAEAEKLAARDSAELASAIGRQDGAYMREIRFYRASGPFGFLSNLYRLEIPIWVPDEFDEKGNLVRKAASFWTSEAAYQYGKPRKQEVADWLVSAPAPHLCAAAAHALFVFDVRSDWNQIKVDRMRSVLRLKFDSTERYPLCQALLATGDAVLIEASNTDAFFGIGKKGNGKNMLGKLLMEVRDELRSESLPSPAA